MHICLPNFSRFFEEVKEMKSLLKIDELNQSQEPEFRTCVQILFELSFPLVRDLILKRPFRDYKELIEKAKECINAMSFQDKIGTVNAHPRIGAPLQSLSDLSKKEQSAGSSEPGLERTLKKLTELNSKYEELFGFKFVVFVNGRSRSDLVAVLEERLNGSKETELQTGLDAMINIALDRLQKLQAVDSSN